MPRTFASRVKEAFPEEPLADPALQAMIRQVYAGGMSREELGLVSEFLRFLNGVARKKLGFFRYHWYRDLRQLF